MTLSSFLPLPRLLAYSRVWGTVAFHSNLLFFTTKLLVFLKRGRQTSHLRTKNILTSSSSSGCSRLSKRGARAGLFGGGPCTERLPVRKDYFFHLFVAVHLRRKQLLPGSSPRFGNDERRREKTRPRRFWTLTRGGVNTVGVGSCRTLWNKLFFICIYFVFQMIELLCICFCRIDRKL